MTGGHGCGSWKRSKKTFGFYKRARTTNTHKWYTKTSTRTEPKKRRGVAKSWSGALQLGKNVYLSGGKYSGVWFEYMGTGHSSGNDSYKVHGLDGTDQTRQMLEYFGVPYNKVWTEQTGVYGIKVPGSALLDVGWPWSSNLGYPTVWDVSYWIWSEDDPVKKKVDYATWQAWITYIDIGSELTVNQKSNFMANIMNDFAQNKCDGSIIYDVLGRVDRADLWEMLLDIKEFYAQRGWALSLAEKQVIGEQWNLLWMMILDDDRVFNTLWFDFHGYL